MTELKESGKREPTNYTELSESQILEKIKNGINDIKNNLEEKQGTIEDAKKDLKKISEWINQSKLQEATKNNISDKLKNLEGKTDLAQFNIQLEEYKTLLESLISKELNNLKFSIGNPNGSKIGQERPEGVKIGLDTSAKDLGETAQQAKNDKNPVAQFIGGLMEQFLS